MNGRHILVVDDDPDLREGLAGLLEEDGCIDSRVAELADGFLRKPFEFEELVELIKKLAR